MTSVTPTTRKQVLRIPTDRKKFQLSSFSADLPDNYLIIFNVSSTDKKHKKLLKNSSLSPLGLRHSPKGTLNKSV